MCIFFNILNDELDSKLWTGWQKSECSQSQGYIFLPSAMVPTEPPVHWVPGIISMSKASRL
jgi:hypothetical protein